MGQQIRFHALPADLSEFFAFARTHDWLMVALRDSDRPEIEGLGNPEAETRVMTLWNQELVGSLKREAVKRPTAAEFYRIPSSSPVLELSPSQQVSWNGRSALLLGRLYGFSFDTAPNDYAVWYSSLRSWIRTHFTRSPLQQFDGYIGRAALEWFNHGGTLLPWPEPPVTPQWLTFVDDQQRARSLNQARNA
jgi:hypothetical protein